MPKATPGLTLCTSVTRFGTKSRRKPSSVDRSMAYLVVRSAATTASVSHSQRTLGAVAIKDAARSLAPAASCSISRRAATQRSQTVG